MKMNKILLLLVLVFPVSAALAQTQVKVSEGLLKGTEEASGIRSFKCIPFAAPPVGDLRWKNPQPAKAWAGVKDATHFGPKAMQRAIYSDMVFRSKGTSEDCLYLNVWTPAKQANEKLPVLVYFYGGGFAAGDGSESRYDGESMAKKGIVTVTISYRLGIFGFLSHPELTKESPTHSSGNYGLMDQHAALVWVHKNIAAFGGDPDKVTIAGESAGSMSVSSQVASPLSKGLFRGAIGESGSCLGINSVSPLKEGEEKGLKFMVAANASSLADLRKIPADKLLELTAHLDMNRFPVTIDGYFFPQSPLKIYGTGLQMDVPLLAGWNSAEVNYHSLLGNDSLTLTNYHAKVKTLYGDRADEVLKLYNATTDADVEQVATDLASDRFIAYATWKWIDLHSKTDGKPVYRYLFTHKLPPMVQPANPPSRPLLGAPHASEIEYAMGNLSLDKVYNWTPDDYKVSATMQNYFANFIKTGNPNGDGLPTWFGLQSSIPKVMILDVDAKSQPEKNLKRYILLDSFYNK